MKSQTAFSVASVAVRGELILAPMDGYSDWPFRSICRELGSAMSYTEFVRAADVLERPGYVEEKLYFTEEERPVVFQVYGSRWEEILEAGLRLREYGPDILDINMGCPQRSIVRRGAGVGMMRSPLEVARVFSYLSSALEIPVTAKIRLGWEDCRNYLLIARVIEENGGRLVAVHGRTKEKGYQGNADWEAIGEVCRALSIPVIGNGDVRTTSDIRKIKEVAGCEGVMIGRGATRNPWIFSGLDREEVPREKVRDTMITHLERNLQFYGKERGLRLFRKFAARYLEPYSLAPGTRKKLLTRTDPREFTALLDEIIN
jgi:nifR3 family TIM-barrel protein